MPTAKGEPPETIVQNTLPDDATSRVVAIGDLHADLEATTRTLQMAGLIDSTGAWIGGDTTLVQTGDTTDRGPDSKAVIELLIRISTEAESTGGRVVTLLGNHEVMNLHGDWRYVSPGDVADFGSVAARQAAEQEAKRKAKRDKQKAKEAARKSAT